LKILYWKLSEQIEKYIILNIDNKLSEKIKYEDVFWLISNIIDYNLFSWTFLNNNNFLNFINIDWKNLSWDLFLIQERNIFPDTYKLAFDYIIIDTSNTEEEWILKKYLWNTYVITKKVKVNNIWWKDYINIYLELNLYAKNLFPIKISNLSYTWFYFYVKNNNWKNWCD